MDYLTGLQDYTARQTEEQLRAERSQDEERARQRSVIGRLRSLFGTKAQVEDPVA